MYFEFDEARRIHQPYTDNFQRSKSFDLVLTDSIHFSGLLEATNVQLSILQLEERHVRAVIGHPDHGAHQTLPCQHVRPQPVL